MVRTCYIPWRHAYCVSNNNAWFTTTYFRPNLFVCQFIICIDLIFTDQTNLAVDSGVNPSLHKKCHQIIHHKFNLTIAYPPPYERLVWDYKRANTDAIINPVTQVDWEFHFFHKKNVHQ